MRRLYVFAGKGGVGKTTLSLAFAKYLQNRHKKKVLYTVFEQNYSSFLCKQLDIPWLQTTMMGSIGSYMERKMGSKVIANTILKAPFFKSLFHAVPGLGYVSLLGGLIDSLKNDDDLTLVFDPPATGHILTMFSSLHNFKEIFGTGIFAKDIDRMNSFIQSEDFLKVTVVSLPTEMALREALELQEGLRNYCHDNIDLIVNDSFGASDELKVGEMPKFLYEKIELEDRVLEREDVKLFLPHIFSNRFENIVQGLSCHMENFL